MRRATRRFASTFPLIQWSRNVVFDIGHVSTAICPFSSETWIYSPAISATGTSKVKLLPSFTGTLPYLVLNDASYDANRRVQTGHPIRTGNPYGKLMAGYNDRAYRWICGATATANRETNQAVPGVKVNTNAMVRVTELKQRVHTDLRISRLSLVGPCTREG